METQIFTQPSPDVTNLIYTDFVDGIRFDIHEVQECCYNMLNNKKYRFYLTCEDKFDYGFVVAKRFFNKTGEERWDFFCKTKQECINSIKNFSVILKEYYSAKKKANKPAFSIRYTPIIKELKGRIKRLYGYDL
jgi:hypothetical protein